MKAFIRYTVITKEGSENMEKPAPMKPYRPMPPVRPMPPMPKCPPCPPPDYHHMPQPDFHYMPQPLPCDPHLLHQLYMQMKICHKFELDMLKMYMRHCAKRRRPCPPRPCPPKYCSSSRESSYRRRESSCGDL